MGCTVRSTRGLKNVTTFYPQTFYPDNLKQLKTSEINKYRYTIKNCFLIDNSDLHEIIFS